MKLKTTTVQLKEQEDEKLFVSPTAAEDEDDAYAGSEDDREVEDEKSHTRLLNDIKKISRKKHEVNRDVRTSLGGDVTRVDTSSILKRLGSSSLKKSTHKLKTLSKPLEKTLARRVKRAAGFENVRVEVNKWAKVVDIRRKADHVSFPLEQEDLRIKTLEKVEPVQLKTPLEQEVYSLLQGAQLIEKKTETEQELATKRALSLQHVKERNRELWRQKEMKRRYEQKAMMQNKSKSRKYHRLMRREKLKKQKAELEQLHKTDPEAALEKLEELERARVQERMTLRHKTSKWAHLQSFRATKDKNAMAALKENHRMHSELTAKVANKAGHDDDNMKEIRAELKEREEAIEAGTYDPMNPWINNLNKAKTLNQEDNDESFTKFKKFWEGVNSRKLAEKKIQEQLDKKANKKDKEESQENEEEEEEEEGEKETEEEEEEEEEEKETEEEKEEEEEEKEEEEENEEEEEGENEEAKNGDDSTEVSKNVKGELLKEGVNVNLTSINKEEILTERVSEIKDKNVQNDTTSEMVSIDDMFDKAEIGIKNRVKRKLEKLGISTESGNSWKKVKRKRKSNNVSNVVPPNIEEFDFSCKNDKDNTDERLERLKTLEDMDTVQDDDTSGLQQAVNILKKGTAVEDSTKTLSQAGSHKNVEVDPTKFLQVDAKKLMTAMPDNVSQGGEGLDDDEDEEAEDAEDVIREAFADDYLIEEFRSEKSAAIERNKPKTMSLALPGWGDWTGPNIKMSNKKAKRFRIRMPRAPQRKDSTMGHVIYNEKADVHNNLRKAMVSDLPYPFKSVKDFEASVRAPLGRMFVPESVHKKLTAPPVVTKMGTVIKPMTEDELLRNKHKGPSANDSHKAKEKERVKGEKVNRNKTKQTQVKGRKCMQKKAIKNKEKRVKGEKVNRNKTKHTQVKGRKCMQKKSMKNKGKP